jgi:hypothetical protein
MAAQLVGGYEPCIWGRNCAMQYLPAAMERRGLVTVLGPEGLIREQVPEVRARGTTLSLWEAVKSFGYAADRIRYRRTKLDTRERKAHDRRNSRTRFGYYARGSCVWGCSSPNGRQDGSHVQLARKARMAACIENRVERPLSNFSDVCSLGLDIRMTKHAGDCRSTPVVRMGSMRSRTRAGLRKSWSQIDIRFPRRATTTCVGIFCLHSTIAPLSVLLTTFPSVSLNAPIAKSSQDLQVA